MPLVLITTLPLPADADTRLIGSPSGSRSFASTFTVVPAVSSFTVSAVSFTATGGGLLTVQVKPWVVDSVPSEAVTTTA